MRLRLTLPFTALILLVSLSLQGQKIQPAYLSVNDPWVDSTLKTLSLDDKIAQLIMYPVYSKKKEAHYKKIEGLVTKYKIGGVIYMQGGPKRQINLHNRLMAKSNIPLLTSMDAEWGVRMRLDSVLRFPRQMMMGAIQDNQLIYEFGKVVANQCKQTGVNVNFAPVVDINVNAKNPVINSRSFGESRENVTQKSIAYMRGMQDHGVLACAKHFPGHGDTDTDSHLSLPVIKHSRERIDSIELYPFKHLVDSGVGSVMVAHLYIPALDSTKNRASTLSPKIVNGMLKKELRFNGLTFTDALNMKGVSKYYETGEVDLLALLAGNDVLLFSQDVGKAIQYIKKAVAEGKISEVEIGRRARKILQLKKWLKLDEFQSLKADSVIERINTPEAKLLKRKIIANALTVLKNDEQILPIKNLDKTSIAALSIGSVMETPFQNTLKSYGKIKEYNITKNPTLATSQKLIKALRKHDVVIIGVHGTSRRPSRNFGITEKTIKLIEQISDSTKTILCLFSNPYSLSLFPKVEQCKGLIMAYEHNKLTQQYTAQLVFGGIEGKGKLPVSGSDKFKVGSGLYTPKIRLGYSVPKAQGMNEYFLKKVDSIALNGIKEGAYPGCQILIARRGDVVYRKAFGHHTYKENRKVKNTDLYDLASITKVGASVPSLMKLVDDSLLTLDYNLCDYLPYVDSSKYYNMNLRRMLAHTAGLVSWIPFYNKTIVRGQLKYDLYSTEKTDNFSVRVAENLYVHKSIEDSIRHWIIKHGIHKKKEYRYSDLGYYFYKDIIEDFYKISLEKLTDSVFYAPLGATTLGYLPRARFSLKEIVPTENDMHFRKQLIHGDVHDPGAAMLGGVGGHAGLFSNANDLAKLFQMYLNGGEYGGKRFFKEEVVKEFTECQYCEEDNRRGAGFDKPSTTDYGPTCTCISYDSYGHTGFTGTMAWADPDKQIIYIFLSNRVYPDADNKKLIRMNIRTDIMEQIYKSLEN